MIKSCLSYYIGIVQLSVIHLVKMEELVPKIGGVTVHQAMREGFVKMVNFYSSDMVQENDIDH